MHLVSARDHGAGVRRERRGRQQRCLGCGIFARHHCEILQPRALVREPCKVGTKTRWSVCLGRCSTSHLLVFHDAIKASLRPWLGISPSRNCLERVSLSRPYLSHTTTHEMHGITAGGIDKIHHLRVRYMYIGIPHVLTIIHQAPHETSPYCQTPTVPSTRRS